VEMLRAAVVVGLAIVDDDAAAARGEMAVVAHLEDLQRLHGELGLVEMGRRTTFQV